MSAANQIGFTREQSDLVYGNLVDVDLSLVEKNWGEISKAIPIRHEQLTLLVKLAKNSKNKDDFYGYVKTGDIPAVKLSHAEMAAAKGGIIGILVPCAIAFGAGYAVGCLIRKLL